MGSWVRKTADSFNKSGSAAAVVNGKLYAVGGYYSATTGEYNPATNTWTARANIPTHVYWVLAGAVNGRVYSVSGKRVSNSRDISNTYEYNPETNTWQSRASYPVHGDNLVNPPGGGTLLGGIHGIARRVSAATIYHYRYDPSTNSWSSKTPLPSPLPGYKRAHAVPTMTPEFNGRLYAFGGPETREYDDDNVHDVPANYTKEYNLATNTWAAKADMPVAVGRTPSVAVSDRAYVITRREMQEYNFASNTWALRTPINQYLSRAERGAAVLNGRVYLVNGDTSGSSNNGVWEYTPPYFGGDIYFWTGSSWNRAEVFVYDGSEWKKAQVHRYTGSGWVLSG